MPRSQEKNQLFTVILADGDIHEIFKLVLFINHLYLCLRLLFQIVSKVISSRNGQTAQALMDPYGSNWLHRLRQIKKIRAKLQPSVDTSEEKEKVVTKSQKKFKVKDFTEFV